MIKTIIIKEILHNVYNLRFIIGLLLSIIVTLLCVVILTSQYEKEMSDYSTRISQQDDFLKKYAHTNRVWWLIIPQKPPEPFRPFIIGLPRDADLGSFDDNPLSALFPHIDLVFIVTVMMSLLALLFSYDALTGERERGTLRLMTAYPVTRAGVLFGKWAGGMLSLMIPFGIALLISLMYIGFHPLIAWSASDYGVFLLLFLTSFFFISIFYLIGLAVSAFSRTSSASILSSLFIWVLMVLVIPNISPYLSAQIYPTPSINKFEREKSRIGGIERDDLGNKLQKEALDTFMREHGAEYISYLEFMKKYIDGTETDPQRRLQKRFQSNPEFKRLFELKRTLDDNAWNEANRIQGEKIEKMQGDLFAKISTQNTIAKYLSCISPYADFVYTATDLTGTGLRSMGFSGHFTENTQQYLNTFREYLIKKTMAEQKKNPMFDSETFLDVHDRPRYSFTEEPLKTRLFAVLPYTGALIGFNILFFLTASLRFLRYDVR